MLVKKAFLTNWRTGEHLPRQAPRLKFSMLSRAVSPWVKPQKPVDSAQAVKKQQNCLFRKRYLTKGLRFLAKLPAFCHGKRRLGAISPTMTDSLLCILAVAPQTLHGVSCRQVFGQTAAESCGFCVSGRPLQFSLAPLYGTSENFKEAIFTLGNGIFSTQKIAPSPPYTRRFRRFSKSAGFRRLETPKGFQPVAGDDYGAKGPRPSRAFPWVLDSLIPLPSAGCGRGLS